MATLAQRLQRILGVAREGPATYPRAVAVPAAAVTGDGAGPPRLARDEAYFGVRLNQLRLAAGRRWWVEVDPMALVVSEFQYGAERISVPFVVGPSLVEGHGQPVPHGMVFDDTLVAGLHPYRGGRIVLTAMLYQVPRGGEAARLLRIAESAGAAFGAATAIGPYLRVAGVLLDAVESLLGLDGVVPVMGRRHEVDPDLEDDLGSGFFVLAGADVAADGLAVHDRRLVRAGGDGPPRELEGADFLLYSLVSPIRRSDLELLAFHPLVREAQRLARSDASDDGWRRAKALMVTAFTGIVDSPDLTRAQGDALRAEYRERMSALHAEAAADALMAPAAEDPRRASALVDAVGILDL